MVGYVEKNTTRSNNGGLVLLKNNIGNDIEINKLKFTLFQVKVDEHLICNCIETKRNSSELQLLNLGKFKNIQNDSEIYISELILFDINRIDWFKDCYGFIIDNYWLTNNLNGEVIILNRLCLNEVSENDLSDFNTNLFNHGVMNWFNDRNARSLINLDFLNNNDDSYESERIKEVTEEPEALQFLNIPNDSDSESFKIETTRESEPIHSLEVPNDSASKNLLEGERIKEEITPKSEPLQSATKTDNDVEKKTKSKKSKKLKYTKSAREDHTTCSKETEEERYKRNIKGFKIYIGFVGLSVIFGFAGRLYKKYLKRLEEKNHGLVI